MAQLHNIIFISKRVFIRNACHNFNNGNVHIYMDSSAVALFIRYFNISLTAIMAIFAVFGVVALVRKNWRLKIFGGSVFFALCVAAIAAFALEATVFNFPYYLKFFAGQELKTTGRSPENHNIMKTSDGTLAEMLTEKENTDSSTSQFEISFKNLNRNVTSIFADVIFENVKLGNMRVTWTDEVNTRSFSKLLLGEYLPHEKYTPIQPCGKVSELSLKFTGVGMAAGAPKLKFNGIALNRQIPLYFSGLRLLAVSLLLFAAFTLFNRALRAKAGYYLFECVFNPASRKQNLVYALSVALLILFSWICLYTTRYSKSFLEVTTHSQYNRYLVDAIIKGRTWLDAGNPEKLLDAERTYGGRKWLNRECLIANGYKQDVDWMFDWAWYKGKHYSYFGAVPAVLLYAPYKLVTGNYLSNHAGIFLFSAIAVVLLALLWRHCVMRYMPGTRFAFVLLSFLALYFACGYSNVLTFPRFYSVPQSAGFMFAVAGILLLFKAVDNEKVNRLLLFFACLCLALVVGCRPNLIFVSIFVPVLL